MGGYTWDVLGIPGYYDCIEVYGGMSWYPRILCTEGLGAYMDGCTSDVLGIPGYYVLRDWGPIWTDVPWMSLVSRDTMY